MNTSRLSLLCLMGVALCCALLTVPSSSFAAAADAASWQGTYKNKAENVALSIKALPGNTLEVNMFDGDPDKPNSVGGVSQFTTADVTATEVKSGPIEHSGNTYRLVREGKTITVYNTIVDEKREDKAYSYTQVRTKPVE